MWLSGKWREKSCAKTATTDYDVKTPPHSLSPSFREEHVGLENSLRTLEFGPTQMSFLNF